jgi:hypothetical protein
MKYHFFTITAQQPEPGERALNAFCAQHRIVAVEKQFVTHGMDSFWSICVTTLDGVEKPVAGGKRDKIDKGVHKAVLQVQKNLQRFPWFVKVDIQRYFPSIDHAKLLELLSHRFKGLDFLALLGRIVASYQSQSGKGLPIGSLTSQHFANYYLDGADRVLRGGSWNNNIGFRLALAHTGVDKLFDPIIIQSVVYVRNGKKQLPFSKLVGMWPNACRSGDFKGATNVS